MLETRLLSRRPARSALDGVADVAAPSALDPAIAALASPDPSEVEKAKTALIARGADAVPPLIRCLEAEGDGVRLRALSLLALLGDPRAAGAVVSLLRDPDASVRARAAGALARIATASATTALARLLERETELSVRLAAARSLVRRVQTGHDEALRPLLELVADPAEDQRVRAAALDAIPWVMGSGEGAPLCPLLSRLAEGGAEPLARKARRMLSAPRRPRLEPWAIETLLRDLRSDRLAVWRRAISRLGRGGGAIVEPLVEALVSAPDNRELAHRVVLALKALSPRPLARLGPFLDQLLAPASLEALVEVAADAGSRALLARLAALIRRLAEAEGDGPGRFDAVRQQAHLALARHGSRLAVDDLRRLLEDRRFPVRPGLAEAAGFVGARRDLPALLRAYRRSRGAPRLALREAVLNVCRRERIRRTDRALGALEAPERLAAFEILGAPRRRGVGPGMPRIDRAQSPLLT